MIQFVIGLSGEKCVAWFFFWGAKISFDSVLVGENKT